ncbi:ABC transporter ATP-binding protein [Microlunatus panaciterrae]|uniref:Osmoprotectant transport system ATP-binding protein n=1 Tax=Microlunatus panaciterrae TaxID=400768 RepID=A0ABS2RHY1_9ACTN|nr:osmoprotectant transport system ATP-binding protein [Microlunatus panaciterrae]
MIEFESVSKRYRDGTSAVVDLSLTIPSDKITVIVGPSGCGKTTTLRMINRMLEPTSGRILWDGAPLRSKRKTALRRQMGYVIQSGGLFPHRTVLENIGTVPGLIGWDRAKTRKRSLQLLSDVGLERKLANRYPAQLSGGQQQRVGVARALAADPMVMLMDEPFSAVDPVVRAELHELFLGLQRELSKTIVLITHDIDEAIKLGDQVAILRIGGKLAQVGTPQQLLDEPADDFVEGFVGRDRGYRALSFLPASGLSLSRVKAVRDPASATGPEPTLVIDADARPLGWADASRPGEVLHLGAIFDPERDTLRAALDSALTSPVGLAVAVSGQSGRYAGIVSPAEILSQVTDSRASIAHSVSVRQAEARLAAGGGDSAIADENAADADQAGGEAVAADQAEEQSNREGPGTEREVLLVGDEPVEIDRSTDGPAATGVPEAADVTAPDAESPDTDSSDTEHAESEHAETEHAEHVASGEADAEQDGVGPAPRHADLDAEHGEVGQHPDEKWER